MRWLHLSDIHFTPNTSNRRDTKQLQEKLLDYIQANHIRVDHLFLTGDYRDAKHSADKGNEYDMAEDVKAAADFIRKIAESAGVKKDKSMVHLVPGNHDMTRCGCETKSKDARNNQAKNNVQKECKNGCVNKPIIDGYNVKTGRFSEDKTKDSANKTKLFDRFGFYKQLRDELEASGVKSQLHNNRRLHGVRCDRDEDFNLLYLNTAITCYGDKDHDRGGDNDHGRLVIGNNDLYDALLEIEKQNPGKPTIVLAHHSMDYFRHDEREVVRNLFNDSQVLLYLCGDTHRSLLRTTNGVIEVTIGCLKTDDDVETVFSEGALLKGNKLSITAHEWRRGNWIKYRQLNGDIARAIKKQGLKSKTWRNYMWILFFVGLFVVAGFFLRFLYVHPEIEKAKLDIAQLPGLNGGWWFEETPWLIPPVREKLMRKLDWSVWHAAIKDQDGKELNVFDSHIPGVHDSLQSIVVPYSKEKGIMDHIPILKRINNKLSKEQSDLVGVLQKLSPKVHETDRGEVHVDNKGVLEKLEDARKAFEDKIDKNKAVDLHTLANLYHRIYLLSDSKSKRDESVKEAFKNYDEALVKYQKKNLKPLEVLCKGDRLRLKYLTDQNHEPVYEEYLKLFIADETLSSLFKIELRTSISDYLRLKGEFEKAMDSQKAAKEGLKESKDSKMSILDHPLAAYVYEREAWTFMDQWKITEAAKSFTIAEMYRNNNYRANPQNQQAYIYVLHNRHGLAMTSRYLNATDEAKTMYEKIRNDIEKEIEDAKAIIKVIIADDKNKGNNEIKKHSNITKYWLDIHERAANTPERLADCMFYGGAASGEGKEKFEVMAKNYKVAAKQYEVAQLYSNVPVMKMKQAIMLMLTGKQDDLSQGREAYHEAIKKAEECNMDDMYNRIRYVLLRELAEAVLEMKEQKGKSCKLTVFANELDPMRGNSKFSFIKSEQRDKKLVGQEDVVMEEVDQEDKKDVVIDWSYQLVRENFEIYLFTIELLLKDGCLDDVKKNLRHNLEKVLATVQAKNRDNTEIRFLEAYKKRTGLLQDSPKPSPSPKPTPASRKPCPPNPSCPPTNDHCVSQPS